MQAIEVKFYCDNNGNSKVLAKCQAGRIIALTDEIRESIRDEKFFLMNWNDTESIAITIASRLAKKLNWDWSENYGKIVMGILTNGDYVFTFTGRNDCFIIK